MKAFAWIIAGGVALLPGAALAQTQAQVEARHSRDYTRCMATGDAAAGMDSAMTACAEAEITRQDARLNQAYKRVMARLDPTQKDALRKSERAWVAQRDARCDKAAEEFAGGTMAAVARSSCILDETIRRTMWLERYRP